MIHLFLYRNGSCFNRTIASSFLLLLLLISLAKYGTSIGSIRRKCLGSHLTAGDAPVTPPMLAVSEFLVSVKGVEFLQWMVAPGNFALIQKNFSFQT